MLVWTCLETNSDKNTKVNLKKKKKKKKEQQTSLLRAPRHPSRSDETPQIRMHPAGDARVSVMPRKVTVKIGDAEDRCRGCRDKI